MKYTVLLLICYIQSVAQTQIHLWPNGAPGFEARKDEPEQAKDWWVKNIHNPSITVYQPATGTANGTAVLICIKISTGQGRKLALFIGCTSSPGCQ